MDVEYFGLYRIIRAVASLLWLINVKYPLTVKHVALHCTDVLLLYVFVNIIQVDGLFFFFLYVKQSNTFNKVLCLKCLLFAFIVQGFGDFSQIIINIYHNISQFMKETVKITSIESNCSY